MKLKSFVCILMLVLAALVLAGCATSSMEGDSAFTQSGVPTTHLDEVPAHERGRCRIWLPGRPPPGQIPPMWNDGHAGRMSGTGDCRAMMAELPPGGMLIEAR